MKWKFLAAERVKINKPGVLELSELPTFINADDVEKITIWEPNKFKSGKLWAKYRGVLSLQWFLIEWVSEINEYKLKIKSQ